jgi:GNAT superfamily N-acetyltransferase
MRILELSEQPSLLASATQYFWQCWGSATNFPFYEDCIRHSLSPQNPLPKFYVLLHQEKIIGTYALLVNDINSRQDLLPWLACLYVDEPYRGRSLGSQLLQHASGEARKKGFSRIYLSTDLENYYEKYAWKHICEGYNVAGIPLKIYEKDLSAD